MTAVLRSNFNPKVRPEKLVVELRPLTFSDFDLVHKWLNDTYILELTFVVPGPDSEGAKPFSRDMSEQYINMLINDANRITFAIEVNGEHVGNVGFKEYNSEFSSSELFIEIGEGDLRGKGVGKAAMAILMDYGFNVLEMNRISLEVLEFNSVAIRVYERIGFIRTGTTGWHYDQKGQYWQVCGMTLHKDKWKLSREGLFLPNNIDVLSLT